MAYDAAKPRIEADLAESPLAVAGGKLDALFPEPPNMDAYRARRAEIEKERAAALKALQDGSMDRKR
jgi:hypothetical protein